MTQQLTDRLGYHPDPRSHRESSRKVRARLELITSRCDLRGKRVLDLGCSGGFFSFELARIAGHVVAVDADREVIERNRAVQADLQIHNLEFVCAPIAAATLAAIGPVDVTLFLSVFHHMLTGSEAYAWNRGVTPDDIGSFLALLQSSTQTLVFEVGQPDEGHEWCGRLPRPAASYQAHMNALVFGSAFDPVDCFPAPAAGSWLHRRVIPGLTRAFRDDPLWLTLLRRLTRHDSRDLRPICIGTKTSRPRPGQPGTPTSLHG